RKRQAAEEKIEELRIVSKAKILLVEKKKMTEDEAHRYIGKQAMDRGVSRRRIAERILDDL
ncbi:MAG: ANTAR domain-containing protein, partial [Lachnospiraceae bacterium]|nr:ANTAR domain-containing protein [Lachnospiraceae bacterium]